MPGLGAESKQVAVRRGSSWHWAEQVWVGWGGCCGQSRFGWVEGGAVGRAGMDGLRGVLWAAGLGRAFPTHYPQEKNRANLEPFRPCWNLSTASLLMCPYLLSGNHRHDNYAADSCKDFRVKRGWKKCRLLWQENGKENIFIPHCL